ncbi:MAG: hypothetical protein M3T96_00795 [Acidobacteriota bacterium]|nr:hypothetical protein [Acidobacteriota bacterium]
METWLKSINFHRLKSFYYGLEAGISKTQKNLLRRDQFKPLRAAYSGEAAGSLSASENPQAVDEIKAAAR